MQPERQFDFWLGEWDAVWEGGSGTNRVEMGFDGKVVQENFNAPDLIGMSVSVYDLERQLWCQTWVDNSGSYLDFTGKFENEKMILTRDAIVKGEICKQRMVWYNIKQVNLTGIGNAPMMAGKPGRLSGRSNTHVNNLFCIMGRCPHSPLLLRNFKTCLTNLAMLIP